MRLLISADSPQTISPRNLEGPAKRTPASGRISLRTNRRSRMGSCARPIWFIGMVAVTGPKDFVEAGLSI